MNVENPRVSVIITSYNQKNYLREAIESVLAQTVPCYEIIIVDDHSSDGSKELIMDYANHYPNLIRAFCHSKNLGIPENRNFALERVKGDYVAILDGDDRFMPHKNEREIQALEANPEAQAVYSNFYFIDQEGSQIGVRNKSNQPSGSIFKEVFAGKFGMLRSMLFRYSMLKETGFMDPTFWHFDGFDLTIRFAKQYYIVYQSEPLCEIRLHSAGAAGWRQPADLLRDLRGVYEKNKHLLKELAHNEAHYVEANWNARLTRLEGQVALRKGERLRAIKKYCKSLQSKPRDLLNVKGLVKFIIPAPLYELVKGNYWRVRRKLL